ncbi:iron-containing redox enzyme family protein [Chamaesiphon minutus]|uniref:Pyrroloquinoline quinone (Coenzyme PQQ) biosynthesis protein C n=1 Tax=Chamaesiphon minutus (strain ATCC 27169 / PCC 6605) TaxID=1173020 RepID=K9UKW4_CHAP6|nr:iron-containing redox enzyme family protein [Chamaesiphon minutus]AFY95278.1 pyrroloquinoline quinone (coenzyme PQQ) biosynthesis protein C [Chamaesiphon minutus PCC 6605]
MTNFENTSNRSKPTNLSENIDSQIELPLKERSSIEHNPQIGFDPERLIPTPTYVEVGIEKLTILADTLGLNDKIVEIVEIFRALAASWSQRKVGETTGWTSDVSDDGSPFEFSIALDPDKAELRVLVEAQGSAATVESNWQAGLELNQYLAEHYNISLDRFDRIADLFAPTNSAAKFSMWHSACFYPDKPSAFKLYLNPQSQQPSRAAAVVEESLVRLGFTHAWPTLAETAAQRGPDKDEFVYFSLDLAAHVGVASPVENRARVKVYLRHQDATPAELESALSAARNYVPGDAIEFCQAMAPGQTSFSAKSAITAFSWVEGDNETPSVGTLHLPISNYATDDRAVCDSIDLYFIEHGLPVSKYQSAIQSFATRQLDAGVGMHSYTSLRREQQQRRVTLYLNPELNRVRPPRQIATQQTKSVSSLEEMVWHYEERTVAHHPFLQRLQRETVNPAHIWLLFMNVREGVVTHFTRLLASVVGRIEDERIRCILTKQLNEELGNGNIDRVHRKLFDRLIDGIEPWQMENFSEEMLTPGKEYSQSLSDIYFESDAYVGVGAAILMEIHGKQFDLCLGQEFRKTNIELSKIGWLTLHEEVEIDHADEALLLSRFIADSKEGMVAAKQGAEKTRAVSWNFLNQLYRLCFS